MLTECLEIGDQRILWLNVDASAFLVNLDVEPSMNLQYSSPKPFLSVRRVTESSSDYPNKKYQWLKNGQELHNVRGVGNLLPGSFRQKVLVPFGKSKESTISLWDSSEKNCGENNKFLVKSLQSSFVYNELNCTSSVSGR